MLAEILIFVPSIANFRINWLMDRLTAAQLASLAADASPTGDVPQSLRNELLSAARIKAVALKRNDQRLLILQEDMPSAIDQTYDLTYLGRGTKTGTIGPRVTAIWDAMAVIFSSGERTVRVIGRPGNGAGDLIEVVLPEAPLRQAMHDVIAIRYAARSLGGLIMPPRWMGYDAMIAPYRIVRMA